jgi:serine protease AprX
VKTGLEHRGEVVSDSDQVDESSGEQRHEQRYDSRVQDRSVVSIPLLDRIRIAMATDQAETPIPVVIDVNLDFPDGREAATQRARDLLDQAIAAVGTGDARQGVADRQGGQYLLGNLQPEVIREVARTNLGIGTMAHPIYRIWPDFEVHTLLDRSVSTVKADALHAAFAGYGKGICWAVLDTGVNASHVHFKEYNNVADSQVPHQDFTGQGGETTDANGHGTHVAGIIAGYNKGSKDNVLSAVRYERDEQGNITSQSVPLTLITGVAPQCSIVSFKVLSDNGVGRTR